MAMKIEVPEVGKPRPHVIVEELPDGTKVAYTAVVVARLADQVYNTLIPLITQHVAGAILGELERRGVIPPAPPFVDPAEPETS